MSEVDGGMPSAVASQRIADHLRDRILSGQLKPGTRVLQDELAEEFEASRLPVREALRILSSTGLVTLRSNRGAWVSKLDQRDCDLSYKIRERLEPLLLSESMASFTPEDVNGLVELQEQIEANSDVEQFLVLDRQLHWATYKYHDAQQLATMVARLWDTTQHYRRAFSHLTGSQRAWIINSEHRLLIEAIRVQDGAMAQRVLAMHIKRTRSELKNHPEVFQT